MVIQSSASALASCAFAQDRPQSASHPLIDHFHFADMDVFEVGEPALKRSVYFPDDGFHALSVGPSNLGFDGLPELAQAFGSRQPDDFPSLALLGGAIFIL
jgi:hypothetical protein